MQKHDRDPTRTLPKGGWNYRLIRHKARSSFNEDCIGVHEVHYDDDGNVRAWTEQPSIIGDTREEVIEVLERMALDCALCTDDGARKILDADNPPWEKHDAD